MEKQLIFALNFLFINTKKADSSSESAQTVDKLDEN
jgi:hypothetical protein